RYRLTISRAVRLVTAVGLDPDGWELSDGMAFEVRTEAPGDAGPTVRARVELDPRARADDRRFVPLDIDLSDVAGRTVELTLATDAGPAGDPTCDWGGWLEPKLVIDGERTLVPIYSGANRIYRNLRALPRAWLVHRTREVAPGDLAAAAAALGDPDFDPLLEAVVEGRPGGRLGVPGSADAARITSYADERVELDVVTAEPALLVVSDMVYPGWRATIDAVEQPIVPTNLVMRGVVVPAGDHRVVFAYRPTRFALGIATAGLCLAGCGAALGVAGWRRRRTDRR
ncbi:MAG: hypothetical protein PVG53_10360, partial [Holophagae bacterium]